MTNLATVTDVELVLQQEIVGDEKIAAAEFALLSVSAAVRNYCRQKIDRVTDDVVVLDSVSRGRLLYLPELPVISVSDVAENGVALAVTGHYQLLQPSGGLYRVGRPWYYGLQTIAVTYTHGYAVIPDDIMAVTARAASRLYQAGLRAAETGGVPGVVSKSLGDFAVTFGSGDTSASEGVMGASAARLLLLSEKDLLNKYRL